MFHKKNYKFLLKRRILLSMILAVTLLMSISNNSYSQRSDISNKDHPVIMKKEPNSLSVTPQNIQTPQENQIDEQMSQIKQSNDPEGGDKLLELQKRLEAINGVTVTKQENSPLGTWIPARKFDPAQTDNITLSRFNSTSGYVIGMATQVEQTGANAGRIWLAIGYGTGDTGITARPDTLAIYYSNNNGSTYNLYAKLSFSSHNRFSDDLDMEIIENTSGTKFVYVVFGYETNGGGYFSQRLIGYEVFTTTGLSHSGATLSFPGATSTNQYFRPRITSDNARYPGIPYVNIVVTEDSVSGGNHYYMSKFLRVLSPFTINPSFTYFPKSIYATTANYFDANYTVQTDIAYYDNVSDSIIFLISGYPGYNANLYLYKAYSNSSVYPNFTGAIVPSGDDIEFARIASNGGVNQTKLLITYSDNRSNSGLFDQHYLSSSNAANWSLGNFDLSYFDQSHYGDVLGRRGADGSFDVAFSNYIGNFQNVTSCHFTNFTITNYIYNLNPYYANSLAIPKPSFRFANGDSCLTFWSDYYYVTTTGSCTMQNIYLTLGVEGVYDQVNDQHNAVEHIWIILRNASPPYNAVDSAEASLYPKSLKAAFVFGNTPDGNYFLDINHKNALETWSAAPVNFSSNIPSVYNFTTSVAQAYGNNMVQKGTKWCLYSGDINRDGVINLADLLLIYNDATNFASGSLATDLNSDTFVNLNDLLIAYNNSVSFVAKMTP